ncbi:MAG: hypothetical protein OEX08_00030 [Candidatus Nomurabacteria bacterium]|nr:hypothetical protein [Candidatus Nomurabacteria bacterium]
MTQRRRIQDISIQSTRKKKNATKPLTISERKKKSSPSAKKTAVKESNIDESYEDHLDDEIIESSNSSWSRSRLWVLTIIALAIVVFFGGGKLLHRASVVITPATEDITTSSTISIGVGDAVGDIPGYLMRIDEQVTESIVADSFKEVSEQASGTIRIFNKESKEQKLREETRFESDSGLIFKLAKGDGVTVPPASGGEPGFVDVIVYADQAGEGSNILSPDMNWVIPGWREIKSPKFETQYAQSVTVMSGGFTGSRPVISKEQSNKLYDDMSKELTDRLGAREKSEVPQDRFILFDGARVVSVDTTINYSEGTDSEKSQATLNGSVYAVLFDRQELTDFIYDQSPLDREQHPGSTLIANGFDDIKIEIQSLLSLQTSSDIVLQASLSGPFGVSWIADESEIKQIVAGASKKSLVGGINHVDVVDVGFHVRPPWRFVFPGNPDLISITNKQKKVD